VSQIQPIHPRQTGQSSPPTPVGIELKTGSPERHGSVPSLGDPASRAAAEPLEASPLESVAATPTAPRRAAGQPSDGVGTGDATTVCLEPPETFFWAAIDVPQGVGTPSAMAEPSMRDAQAELLGSVLLPPLETLHWCAVGVPAASPGGSQQGAGTVVFCLADRDKVAEARSNGLLHYGPASVPPGMGDGSIDPMSLNLLVGTLTPLPIQAAQQKRWWLAALVGTLLAGSLLIGIERRRAALEDAASTDQALLSELLAAKGIGSPAELMSRRDRLAITRKKLDESDAAGQDAATALAALLAAWPRTVPAAADLALPIVQAEQLNASKDSVTVQLAAWTREDATRLAELLGSFPAGGNKDRGLVQTWSLGQPQITMVTAASGTPPVRATFRFSRTTTGGMPSSPNKETAR